MGTLLDTTVFIEADRSMCELPMVDAAERVFGSLDTQLGQDEEVGIAVITASELLHGVHRAAVAHRARREAFVEAVLAAFPPIAFWMRLAGISGVGGTVCGMVKTTVYLPDDLDVKLESEARLSGVSKAELIRQGVSLVLAQSGHPRPSQPLPAFTSGRPLTPAAMDDAIYDHIRERAARR